MFLKQKPAVAAVTLALFGFSITASQILLAQTAPATTEAANAKAAEEAKKAEAARKAGLAKTDQQEIGRASCRERV